LPTRNAKTKKPKELEFLPPLDQKRLDLKNEE